MKNILFKYYEGLKRIHCFRLLFFMVFFLSVFLSSEAQQYQEKITKDSIVISYRWEKERKLKKDNNYVLQLQIKNTSSVKKTVDFSVLFYWKAQLHSSSNLNQFCIAPGKKIRGEKWGLNFQSSVFSIKDYLDPLFSWTINDLEIKNNQTCNPHLKLKLVPAFP